MVLSAEDVKKIAHLARLAIDEEAISDYAKNLTDILAFVEQMNRIDTTEVTPMAHPQDTCQRLREDRVTETNRREYFQKFAPRTESALYLVPKVIE